MTINPTKTTTYILNSTNAYGRSVSTPITVTVPGSVVAAPAFTPAAGTLQLCADGDDQYADFAVGDDILHHRWNYPDDQLDGVFRSDHRLRFTNAEGYRYGYWLFRAQRSGSAGYTIDDMAEPYHQWCSESYCYP